jgi:catechol 2,3-dioxygenase-like lactoylglutathione lyase family enzyme
MPEHDPIAQYKDLCIDAVDIQQAGRFWGVVLGLKVSGRKTISLTGPTPMHRIWINEVPEVKTVKNRVHLDVHAGALTDLEAIGARVLEPQSGDRHWTVMADPDGQEFCAFVRDEVPDNRLYEIGVDCSDPEKITRWWAELYGVQAQQADGYWFHEVPGAPFEAVVFVQVPEGKKVKNRVHWDIRADPQRLMDAGATLIRPKGRGIRWTVLADPDGNEFCAFTPR